jgi:uncharacterized membrane protein
MIVLTYNQFLSLTRTVPSYDDIKEFNQAIKEQYGIERMMAKAKTTTTSWDIYFVDDKAELVFKLKYSEYL